MRALVVWLLVTTVATARAERLPVRLFTTADGLANNRVEAGARDPHGFLWFATAEGVSRFDNHQFESFGLADGLPAASANDIAVTPDGKVWVATDAGIAVLDLEERAVRPRFRAVTKEVTWTLLVDPSGVLWAGMRRGLQRIEGGRITDVPGPGPIMSLAYDARDRSLWLGTFHGLVHRHESGTLDSFRVAPLAEDDDRIFDVLVARDGTLWIAHVGRRVLAVKRPLTPTATPLVELDTVEVHVTDGFARRRLLEDSSGTIWIGTSEHLYRWTGSRLEQMSAAQIGVDGAPGPSVEDPAGNLWFGTDTYGVVRLARGGFASYDPSDGLVSQRVYGFARGPAGELYPIALYEEAVGHAIHRRDGDRYVGVKPRTPEGVKLLGWGYGQVVVRARDGRWWWPTAEGLARFPAVDRIDDLATTAPERITDLPGKDILRIYEDHRGDVWITTGNPTGIARWDRATDRFVTLREGYPRGFALAYAEDLRGDLWIGFWGQLARVHDGVPRIVESPVRGAIEALLVDRSGRLWIGSTSEGLARVDDLEHPAAAKIYRAADLGSDQVATLVEDLDGRIYAGTSRGIARIDPGSGEVVHFGLADGLRNDFIAAAARDVDGTLWFGSKGGLARLIPDAAAPAPPDRVYVMRVAIAGTPQPIAPGGEQHPGPFELAHDAGFLDIELASPQFAIGASVRFQYRIDDAWSAPAEEHALHFARLAPGDYEIEIRAVDAHGGVSPSATIEVRVVPPLWRRWWFITGWGLVIALLAYAGYRRRLAHVLALERVRRRIATDLHDELGSSLSRIAILSEVAARTHEDPGGQLGVIGTSARELVDAASDIVWSTDPRRDDLHSLIVRLRSFAADVLEARGVAWTVTAPELPARIKLDPERRRHLYLILKEAIHNAAKHAGASRVEVSIVADDGHLVATVRDDGRGFDEASLPGTGNGLANMRARAADAGGTLEVRTKGGTEVVLRI